MRDSPKKTTSLTFYYILDGKIYQAPPLHAAMTSRMVGHSFLRLSSPLSLTEHYFVKDTLSSTIALNFPCWLRAGKSSNRTLIIRENGLRPGATKAQETKHSILNDFAFYLKVIYATLDVYAEQMLIPAESSFQKDTRGYQSS